MQGACSGCALVFGWMATVFLEKKMTKKTVLKNLMQGACSGCALVFGWMATVSKMQRLN
jgi:hypothetical protein